MGIRSIGGGVFAASLSVEALADTTPYVLVDLSDTTNYPHKETDHLYIHKLILSAEKHSDGVHDIYVGVVVENDADNGSVRWIHVFHLEAVGNPTDSTDRFHGSVDFTTNANPDGLNLEVNDDTAGSEKLRFWMTNGVQSGHANWQNDTNRTSPVGGSTKPGAGDLVFMAEEVSGSGTLDFFLTAIYSAA